MSQNCDLCGAAIQGRLFQRRDFDRKRFCSVTCVAAFETQAGLPSGRIYESRPGWSSFPVAQPERSDPPC